MVFESVVTDILNRFLGDYIENLDSKQLKLGIWGGDIVLTDLHLKQTALKDLGLPIQIIYGRLENLVLKIPWSNLYGAAVEATVEGLFLLLASNNQVEYNAEKEEQREYEHKRSELKKIDDRKKLAEVKANTNDTFVEKLVTQIIKNVQIIIKNIHVRYEDRSLATPFAMGTTLSGLTVQTTNEAWHPTILQNVVQKIFKIVALEGLAVYWNCDTEMFSDLSNSQRKEAFIRDIANKRSTPEHYKYILGPINSEARLVLNPKPEHNPVPFDSPKAHAEIKIERLEIGISMCQYRDIVTFADSMQLQKVGLPYRKYRPSVPYHGHAKEWWNFAFTCIMETDIKRRKRNWDWNNMCRHREICQLYGELYKTQLTNKKVTKDVAEELNHCEKVLDLYNLVLIRQRISMEIELLDKMKKENEPKGWFSGWFGSSKPFVDIDNADYLQRFRDAMTPEEKQKLFAAIDYNESDAPTLYPPTYIDTVVRFELKEFKFNIRNDITRLMSVIKLKMTSVKSSIARRPKHNGLKVQGFIGNFVVTGVVQNNRIPEIITSNVNHQEQVNLAEIMFEMNPFDMLNGNRVHVIANPLQVCYDFVTMQEVINVFHVPSSSALDELSKATAQQYNDIKEKSALGLQNVIEKHSKLDIYLKLSAPIIIIPYGGWYTGSENLLILNLGTFIVKSVINNDINTVGDLIKSGFAKTEVLDQMILQSYDRFQIDLTGLQLMISQSDENWLEKVMLADISPMHLLLPINMSVLLESCIVQNANMPLCKISAAVPSIFFRITDARLMLVLGLTESLSKQFIEESHKLTRSVSTSSLKFVGEKTGVAAKNLISSMSESRKLDKVQMTLVRVKFELNAFRFNFAHQDTLADPNVDILDITFNLLTLAFHEKTSIRDVSLYLESIHMDYYIEGASLPIISTQGDREHKKLFKLDFMQVQKSHPEFSTTYDRTLTILSMNFYTLEVLLHHAALLDLARNINDIQMVFSENSGDVIRKSRSNSISSVSSVRLVKDALKAGIDMSRERKRTVSNVITFKLNANLEQIVICFEDVQPISRIAITGLHSDVAITGRCTKVLCYLNHISVTDLNPLTKYKNIIDVDSVEKAIDVSVTLYNNPNDAEPDIDIKATLGKIRSTFVFWYLTNMLNFINSFATARTAMIVASQKAAKVAKLNIENIYDKATKVHLDIRLNAPEIIVPEKSTSWNAFYLDLGFITITNDFKYLDVKNAKGHNVIIDEIQFKLVKLAIDSVKLSNDSVVIEQVPILQPVSFTLEVSRNLSLWYTAIPDIDINGVINSIHLDMSNNDYTVLMKILSENMSEGSMGTARQTILNEPLNIALSTGASLMPIEISTNSRILQLDNEDEFIKTSFKWNFAMHSFKLNLFNLESLGEDSGYTRKGLGELSMIGLLVKGRMLSNNSITNSLLLMNVLLKDTRPDRKTQITEVLYRTAISTEQIVTISLARDKLNPQPEGRNMIDMTLQTKKGDTFIDLRVYSFTFLLSVEYLLELHKFFQKVQHPEEGRKTVVAKKSSAAPEKISTDKGSATNALISVAIKLEKPDIILVENIDDLNTRALVLNFELLMKLRLIGEKHTINGTLSDFQVYSCVFNPAVRENTRNMFLEPCTLSIAGSTPEGKGLHVEVYMSTIFIGVSVYTIELLNNVLQTLSGRREMTQNVREARSDLSKLWTMKKNKQFWFLQTEEGEDALTSKFMFRAQNEKAILNEVCLVNVPQIIITLQAGVGYKTYPILAMESTFHGKITNWSSDMSVDATLSLQMGYYNNLLALWEPIVEPIIEECVVLGKPEVLPWEIRLEVNMNERFEKEEKYELTEDSTLLSRESQIPQPAMTIDIFSSNNLELTVTKTALDVFANVTKMFSAATTATSEDLKRNVDAGLYKVVNTLGTDIIIELRGSNLIHKGHVAATSIKLEQNSEVYLDPVTQRGPNDKTETILSYGRSLQEKYLKIEIPQFQVMLTVPYLRAVSRYYRLSHVVNTPNERYLHRGVVSTLSVVNGINIITLSSVVQVQNCFNVPIDIYYMRQSGNELELIEVIQPNGTLHIPLHAVYSATSELFFGVAGHSVTTTPYVWRDLQLNVAVNKTLVCSSMTDARESFVIKVIGEMQQIYYENTIKYTISSTMYKLSLRPAVIFQNCLPYEIEISVNDPNPILLTPGNSVELPNVDPGNSEIVAKLPKYLDKSWVCKREITNNPPPFSVWTLDSHDSIAKMSLDLGMHCLDQGGSCIMSLYCPFWMINKTGLILSYRTSDENTNVLYHPAYLKEPILFSFNAKNFFGKKKACVKVNQGDWCEKFSIDVAGSSGVIMCAENGRNYQIGVQNSLTYNGLTKMITFTPYFVIINQSTHSIECQEDKRPADPWIVAEPKSCIAFWPISDADDKLIRVRILGTAEISIPFLIIESHTTLVKLRNKFGGINVDIQLTEGAVYINLALYDEGMAPALVINNTLHTMNIWEKKSIHIHKLPPNHNMYFTWDYPSSDRILVWEAGYKQEVENELRMDGVGSYEISSQLNVYWVSFLDGMQRVLLFTCDETVANNAQSTKQFEIIDREITVSLHGLGISIVNNLIRQEIVYIGIASTGIIWETCKHNGRRFKQMSTAANMATEREYQSYLLNTYSTGSTISYEPHMEVDFAVMEQIRPRKRKIQRRFQTGIWLQMKTSQHQMQLHAKINRLQIDNQLHDCSFPVLLAPVPPPKTVVVTDANKPFAEVSIVQLLMKNSQIQQYKYFKVLIQEFHVKVDLGFINSIMEVFYASKKSQEEEKEHFLDDVKRVADPLYSLATQISMQEQKSFYDLLHFSPLKIHVSFSMVQGGQTSGMSNIPIFLSVLLQGIGVTLTDMQDVVFKLAYFEREYSFLTQKQLISETMQHYVGQTVKQLYVLVLGLDVIGNPYGLVLGITKGVEDLFYEPFQGAIQGPGEFAEGLAFGVASLFGHTFGGAAGAVSRITGAMGKGIAALSFDKDFQRKRRDQLQKRPATAKEGFARGGKGLVMGVVDGVTGVFTKPISGAKEQGIGGFFKGLGKGAVGLVARPTAGVMDFASSSFESVKRVTDFNTAYINRLRPPRFIQLDKLIKPYDAYSAAGNKLLAELDKGKYYSTDIYAHHFTIIEKKEVLLLTDKRIAYIMHNDIFGGWQVEWTYAWQELDKCPTTVAKGVLISVDPTKKARFKSSDQNKLVFVANLKMCDRIIEEVSKHIGTVDNDNGETLL